MLLGITDCTLTEGNLNPFCKFTLSESEEFLILLNLFGIEYVEINTDYKSLIQFKKDNRLNIKIIGCVENLDLCIVQKCLDYDIDCIKLITNEYNQHKIIDVCKYIKSSNENIEIILSIKDSNPIYEYLYEFEKLINRIQIVDTLGIITHCEIEETFDLIQDSTTLDLDIEYKFKNDTSSAVYNSYTALLNGCTHIALSVLGIGDGNGITDLSGFISRIYASDNQLLKKYDLTILKDLDKYVSKKLNLQIPINNPITGICSWDKYSDDFNTNIIFTNDINLFKAMFEHIMPSVFNKLDDEYILKLYEQIIKDTSNNTPLYIKLNSDIDYTRDYILKYIS